MNDINTEEGKSISILMANYNHEQYIEIAIKSILNQTYPNWELVIVDDQSTDNSLVKIKPFLKDKRIKLIKNDVNLGYGGTLRVAANQSTKKILGVLDPDDKLHEKALEIIINAYNKYKNFGVIYSNMRICNSELKNGRVSNLIKAIYPPKTNLFYSRVSHFKTFLKSAYDKTSGFDPYQKKSVDKDILYKLEEITNFKFIDKPLYYYRVYSGGISQGKSEDIARLYHFRAKFKAYKRRLNTNLPNYSENSLKIEYYKIIKLYNVIRIIGKILRTSNINRLITNTIRKLPNNSFKFVIKKIYLNIRSLFLI